MIRVRLTQKKAVAEDIAAFELMALDNSPLPAFSAGAHIDVHLRNGLVRQYSLCNNPEDRLRYVLGVLLVPNSRGGSTGMHMLDEGDTIEISEPRNHFPLVQDAERSILVAGGIGLTPLLSMAESLVKTSSSFVLHYCVRNVDRAALRDRLALHDLAPHVRLHLDSDYTERAFEAKTLFAEEIRTGTHVYVCGPGGFIETVLAVHREYFNAAIRDADVQDAPFTIRIASTGEDIEVGAKQRVIDALAARGVVIPVSCEQGVFGTCLTRVIDGIPDHRDTYLTDLERAGNEQFTPCCSARRFPKPVLIQQASTPDQNTIDWGWINSESARSTYRHTIVSGPLFATKPRSVTRRTSSRRLFRCHHCCFKTEKFAIGDGAVPIGDEQLLEFLHARTRSAAAKLRHGAQQFRIGYGAAVVSVKRRENLIGVSLGPANSVDHFIEGRLRNVAVVLTTARRRADLVLVHLLRNLHHWVA